MGKRSKGNNQFDSLKDLHRLSGAKEERDFAQETFDGSKGEVKLWERVWIETKEDLEVACLLRRRPKPWTGEVYTETDISKELKNSMIRIANNSKLPLHFLKRSQYQEDVKIHKKSKLAAAPPAPWTDERRWRSTTKRNSIYI